MRLAIPSTALLTQVFLQQTRKAELPSTPYLTFLDELYACSYLLAVGLFILFLWGLQPHGVEPGGGAAGRAAQHQSHRRSLSVDGAARIRGGGSVRLVPVRAGRWRGP